MKNLTTIPVHREIYRGAAKYYIPYSAEDTAMVIRRVLSEQGGAARGRFMARARQVSDSYAPHNILPQWEVFLQRQKNPALAGRSFSTAKNEPREERLNEHSGI